MADSVNVRVSDSGKLYPNAVVVKVGDEEIIAGRDGVSPVVTTEAITHGNRVTITDAVGEHVFDVMDGASAYEQAVAGGYEGTEAEFAEDLAGFSDKADAAEAAAASAVQGAQSAINSASTAATEAGEAAASAATALTHRDAADSSAQSAATSATSAGNSANAAAASASAANSSATSASASESNAANSAANAAASETAAAASESAAAASATAASNSAAAAAQSASAIGEYEHDAEAWAIGKRGGQDVPSTDDTYHNNSKYHSEQAAANNGAAAQKASEAASSAQAASQSAQNAAASAAAASQSEDNAASSATAAAGSASTASTAATTAQGHATNAASSATAASGSATAAANAQTAAETAQGKAEDAQEAAEAVLASIPSDYTELSEDVDELKSAINGLTDLALPIGDLQNGAYTATVGEALSSTSGRHYYIDCSDYVGKSVTVKFTNTNTASVRATALCDNNQIVGQTYQQKNMTSDGFVFGVTSTYKYLYISFDNGGASNFSVTVPGVISGMVDDISEINNKIGDTALPTISQTITGAIKEVNDKVDNIDIDNSGTEIGGVEVPVLDNPFGLKLYDIGGGHYRVNKHYNDFYKDANVSGIEWTRIYLNPVTGSDSNDGSQNSPVKTLNGAIGKNGTNIRVILPSGKYGVLNAGITGTVTNQSKNIMVECPDGVYEQRWGQLCSARTFTETSSGSGVWQNSMASSPVSVTDDNYYTKAESMSACESTPRSFFYSSGVLYIHTNDGTSPQTQFMEFTYPATTINAQTGATVMILRNVHLTDALYKKGKCVVTIGGDSAITALKTFVDNVRCQKFIYSGYHTLYAKGLVIDGTPMSDIDGLTTSKPCAVWLEGCVIRDTGADGYNYHNVGATGNPCVVELECVGVNCGMELQREINNCTTLHENCQAIRIGGGYYNSRNRAVHDVHTSKSFNAFCSVRQAERAGNITMDFAVGANASDTVEMYIYNCNMDGSKSTYNVGVFAGTGNKISAFGTNLARINGAEQIDAGWNPFAD